MHKVIGIGESVLDIIFRNNQPETAAPGGSTFNSMVSLGRAGVPSYFVSEVGNNRPGDIIMDFMKANGVCPDCVNVLPVKQPVSMAFLDEKNDAEYSFYRDALDVHPAFRMPPIDKGDVVLFGSFFALNPVIRPQVKAFLEHAKASGAVLYYDVNFRPAHKKDLGDVMGAVEENYGFADFVRGSDQDFMTLYGIDDPEKVYSEKILPHCRNFIYTKSTDPIEVFAARESASEAARGSEASLFRKSYPVAKVDAVSTIGAGDNFNAGFIYALLREGLSDRVAASSPAVPRTTASGTTASHTTASGLSAIPEAQWDKLIAMAQAFSADCCTSRFNYITPAFAETLK